MVFLEKVRDLALPMKGQFEQQLNGYLLEKMGYGKMFAKSTTTLWENFSMIFPGMTSDSRITSQQTIR